VTSRAAAALLCGALAASCRVERAAPPAGVLTLTATEQVATWTRNFNPLVPGSRWPTAAGIYEPLAIYNSQRGEWVPWLATAWEWRDDGRTLAFRVRPGVSWSDGRPFGAGDVAYTFELLRRHPALDQRGAWAFLAGVEAVGDEAVFRFSRDYAPGLAALAHQPIVPEHAWRGVGDPVTYTNPEPVATGPYTQVRVFRSQVYELGRNPRYWQPGKPAVEAIRMPAFPGNDAANLALVDGELDWAANYVPAVERVFVRRDPEHHRYWFPPLGGTVFLYANTTRGPLSEPRVRKALSRAIDRSLVVDVAMSRYTSPADATGLSASFEAWRDAAAASFDPWTKYDPSSAAQALDDAGLRRDGSGGRVLPDGTPFAPTITVVNGWSDWVRAAQVVARGLEAVGVRARVRLLDQGAWFEQLQKGEFELAIAWSVEGATPYEFYRWLMRPEDAQPTGVAAPGNWHRWSSEAARPVFAELERTRDAARARELSARLQRIFVEEAPAIPLFPNPSWGEFNTRRFEGFPDASDPWAALSPNKVPDCLLVLTALRPRTGGPR
jgi:peptide/nickel transport system substrate-binding protein